MKTNILLIAAFFLGVLTINAQNEDTKNTEFKTILGNQSSVGGYGAFGIHFTEIEPGDGLMFNARGGVVLNHWFSAGISGSGFISDYFSDPNETINPMELNLAGGYGGLYIEPILLPFFPVHISLPIFGGVGGVALLENIDDELTNSQDYDNVVTSAGFMVFEPGVELEFNVTNFFRLAVGGYYRMTSKIDIPTYGFGEYPLNGISGGVTFKFGKF